jgi:hypothetical protein
MFSYPRFSCTSSLSLVICVLLSLLSYLTFCVSQYICLFISSPFPVFLALCLLCFHRCFPTFLFDLLILPWFPASTCSTYLLNKNFLIRIFYVPLAYMNETPKTTWIYEMITFMLFPTLALSCLENHPFPLYPKYGMILASTSGGNTKKLPSLSH